LIGPYFSDNSRPPPSLETSFSGVFPFLNMLFFFPSDDGPRRRRRPCVPPGAPHLSCSPRETSLTCVRRLLPVSPSSEAARLVFFFFAVTGEPDPQVSDFPPFSPPPSTNVTKPAVCSRTVLFMTRRRPSYVLRYQVTMVPFSVISPRRLRWRTTGVFSSFAWVSFEGLYQITPVMSAGVLLSSSILRLTQF